MRRLLTLSVLLLGLAAEVKALDTTEPFELGFSDMELYYNGSAGGSHTLSVAFGVGVSPLLNPVLSPEVSYDGTVSGYGVAFQNVMALYDGAIGFDLIPGVTTDFAVVTAGLGMEVTVPLQGVTPYVQGSADYDFDQRSTALGVAFGAAFPVARSAELFLEGGQVWESGVSYPRAGLGLNVGVSDNVELITELGYGQEWTGLVGLIQTL